MEMQVVDPDRFSNSEEAAEAKEYAGLVWEAASSLDERQYSALHYSVRLGFDNEELAEVLGVTRNNAYQIVNRTKQALENAIGALVLLRQGRRFCKELDSALVSLQVGELPPEWCRRNRFQPAHPSDMPVYAETSDQAMRRQLDELEGFLKPVARTLEGFQVQMAFEISSQPADAIVDVARRVKPTFILMTRTTNPGIAQRVFGTVAQL